MTPSAPSVRVPPMFIRRTQTRSTPSGQTYFTHRLVRSHRVSGKVRQQTLLNLGCHFSIPRHHWPLLCRRLDQILSGQLPLLPEASTQLEEEAQRMAQRLLEGEADVTGTGGEASSEDLQTVEVGSVELTRPRSVRVEQVGCWALEQLGLVDLLGELGLNGPMRAAAVGAIVGRLARPGSERATWGWLGRRSGLGELLDFDFQTLSLMQMYRASDALMKHRQAIEAHLFTRAMGLFDLQPTVTLFDLTNTFFEGAASHQPKAQRGHSKDKRSDCPLLTLGLVLDGAGFVRRSQVFAGRVDEPRTLAGMLEALEAPRGALVVMDRGVATEDRIQWLREEGYRYVVASRQGHRQFDPELALTVETASKATVQLHKEVSDDGREVRLYCCSQQRAQKERGIVERFSRRLEQGLTRLSQGLSRPRTHKGIEKVRERIGRLKEQSRGVAQHYSIEVLTDDSGRKATALTWTRRPRQGSMATHPGVYCLRSNQTDWDEESLWRTYTTLTDVEAVFRSLKSELGLRPIYHHKPVRSEGHLFLTVIAYQLVQVIRKRLKQRGDPSSWTTLRRILEGQQRVTVTFRRGDGRTLHVRKATRAETDQKAIYDRETDRPEKGELLRRGLGFRQTVANS